MTGIKALLMKDLLYLKSLKKNILLLFLFYFIFGAMNQNVSIVLFIGMFLTINFTMQAFHYDTYASWDVYFLSFPLTRTDAVISRYIFGLILGILGLLFGILIFGIIVIFHGTEMFLETPVSALLYGNTCAFLLIQGIMYPVLYQFGIDKGRILFVSICFIIPMVLLSFGKKLFDGNIPAIISENLSVVYAIIPVIALLFYIGSFFLSLKIMNKRKF